MSITETDRQHGNREEFPHVYGDPEQFVDGEGFAPEPVSFDKPVSDAQLLAPGDAGFDQASSNKSNLRIGRRIVTATVAPTPANLLKAAAEVAPHAAKAVAAHKENKLLDSQLSATVPEYSVEKTKQTRSKTKRWIAGMTLGTLLVGGGIATVREFVLGGEKTLNHGLSVLGKALEASQSPTAEVNVTAAVSSISLDKDEPLVDATGGATVKLYEHGRALYLASLNPGNWHKASTEYGADFQIAIKDAKDNIDYSTVLNPDGSSTLVATINQNALEINQVNATNKTQASNGPSTHSDNRYPQASSNLAEATFENECSPVDANLIPEGIANKIKSSENASIQTIESLQGVTAPEKNHVAQALKLVLAKPIIVRVWENTPNGPIGVPISDLNLVSLVKTMAKTQAANEKDPQTGKPQPRPYILTGSQVAQAVGFSPNSKQVSVNNTNSCDLTQQAASDLLGIKGQNLVAKDPLLEQAVTKPTVPTLVKPLGTTVAKQ